jgi:hypothetical protein
VLRLIQTLPDDGVFAAMLAADPPTDIASSSTDRADEPSWRRFLGWGTDRHLAATAVDVFVSAHTPREKTPVRVERPAAKKAGIPLSQLMPRRGPAGAR